MKEKVSVLYENGGGWWPASIFICPNRVDGGRAACYAESEK